MPEYDCHGIWFSWIKVPKNTPILDLKFPPTDQAFEIYEEDAEGKFTGIHLVTKGRLAGQCVLDPHHITFNRFEGTTVYTYDGEITTDAATGVLVARGTRRTLFLVDREFRLQDDDEWVGVKTT